VSWAPLAEAKAKRFESDPHFADFQTMMVKTHLSLTHDPTLKGVPKGWTLPIRDVLVYSARSSSADGRGDQPDARHGVRPGLPPRRRRRETGEVSGLF